MGNQNHPVNAAPRRVSFGASNNQGYYENNGIVTTKYTWWNFIPKGIYLQFLKPANIFYLFVAILQCIPVISALHPVASVAPFIIVIAVSLIKEAYEDNVSWKVIRRKGEKTIESPTMKHSHGDYSRVSTLGYHGGRSWSATSSWFSRISSSRPTCSCFFLQRRTE